MVDEQPKKTLTDFIDQNHKLLSTIGIFAALSVFINQLPGDLAKSDASLHSGLRILSAILCLLATMAFIEVLKNAFSYPDEQWFVRLFAELLFLVFVNFVIVWVKTFYFGVVIALAFVAGITCLLMSMTLAAIVIALLMKRTSFLKSYSQRTREQLIPTVGSLILTAVGIILVVRFHH